MNNLFFSELKVKKDEFLYNSKNRTNRKNTYYVIAFIAFALFISLIIVQLFGYNFGTAFTHIFSQSFNVYLYKDLLFNFAIYGLSAIAFVFAYKSGLFNIGITGQMMGAGLAIIAVAQAIQPILGQDAITGNPIYGNADFSKASGIVILLIVGVLVGGCIAGFTGLLKVIFNIHEVVSSILINWIIFFLAKFLIGESGPLNNPIKSTHSYQVSDSFSLYDPSQSSGFIAAICIFFVCLIVVWVVLKYTTFGKKIKSVGIAKPASFYAGYSTKTYQFSSFAISGAIAGFLAAVVYTGSAEKAMPIPQIDSLPTYGFDGISLGLIAFSNPIAIIPVAFFMGMIQTSSSAAAPFPSTLANMMLGIIMYGTAIFVLFYRFKLIFRMKQYFIKKKKLQNNYYVNEYDKNKNVQFNEIEKQLAIRKNKIFIESQKIKTKNILDKFKEKNKILKDYNNRYLNDVNKLGLKNNLYNVIFKNKLLKSKGVK